MHRVEPSTEAFSIGFFFLLSSLMALTQEEQFEKLVLRSHRILVLLPEHPNGDHIGAGFGLAHFLNVSGVEATIAYADPHKQTSAYHFLPQPDNIRTSLKSTRDFVLTFKTSKNDITSVRHEREDDILRVHVTPEHGMIDSRDFSFDLGPFPYDLIISLGAINKKSLGPLATDAPDLFYDVPLVNIDVSPANEHHGQLNIITLTASSVSEVITRLCFHVDKDYISQEAASCLLTGLISATNSFRAKETTPRTLTLASDLIERGANQQDIVTQLYKSQPLGLIKLWGKALERLTKSDDGLIISTSISQEDFRETGTQPYVVSHVIEQVKKNYTDGKVFIVVYENDTEEVGNTALIDASRFGRLPEQYFGTPSEKDFYTRTLHGTNTEEARKKITEDLRTILSDK